MNEIPRKTLRRIIHEYGEELCNDPKRCEAFLMDLSAPYKKEIFILISTLRAKIPQEIMRSPLTIFPPSVWDGWTRRLQQNLALSKEAARWAVESWGFALNVQISKTNEKSKNFIAKTKSTQSKKNETEWTVSPSGNGKFRTISEAVNSAPAGTRILIRPGRYTESLTLDKPLSLTGDGPIKDILWTAHKGPCLLMKAGKANVNGVTLRSIGTVRSQLSNAIEIVHGKLILENCDISSDGTSAIIVAGPDTYPTIRKCKIRASKKHGIELFDQSVALLEKCEFSGNLGSGLLIKGKANPLIRECKFFANYRHGVEVEADGLGKIKNCEISENLQNGVFLEGKSDIAFEKCLIHSNRLHGISANDYSIALFQECEVRRNLKAGIETVNQANPTFKRCRIFNGKAGLFVHNKGRGLFEECDIYKNKFACVEIKQGGDPILDRCRIYDGKSAGVFVYDKGRGSLKNCKIFENDFAGIAVKQKGNPTIINCRVTGNRKFGIDIFEKGSGRIQDVVISANNPDGVSIRQESDPFFSGCQILGNHVNGLTISDQGKGFLDNCRISRNGGSGIDILRYSHFQVRNCQIIKNRHKGVCLSSQSSVLFENCDMTGNRFGAWDIEQKCKIQFLEERIKAI